MVFTSLSFLFLFLPLFLATYYLVRPKHRSLVILLGSYTFYGWWRLDFLLLLIAVSLWTYAFGVSLIRERNAGHPRAAQVAVTMGIIGNLAALAFFKYFNFGADSINALLTRSGRPSVEVIDILLPIGISFYVFQSISYLVDVYRNDSPPARSFVDFGAFVALFPQLIAGPILRYKDLVGQFAQRTHSFALFSEGAGRFMLGFSKKVLIADTLAPLADFAFAQSEPGLVMAWLGALAYTGQLFFDFSGYSDMAIGLGRMMGFRFLENFDQPYISRSITEFWRRWHISLSNWLRDYLYIPLGGNRKGTGRTYVNLMITMLLGGLWHGANWTFVLWGAWHGLFLALERGRGIKGREPSGFRALLMGRTMLIVVLGWVVFRATSLSTAIDMFRGMVGIHGLGSLESAAGLGLFELLVLVAAGLIVYRTPLLGIDAERLRRWRAAPRVPLYSSALVGLVFLLAITRLTTQSFSPFLYFQF